MKDLDNILQGVELPSEKEIALETRGEISKRKWLDPVIVKKWKESMNQKVWTKDVGKKISAKAKVRTNQPGYRAEKSRAQTERMSDPDARENLRKKSKQRLADGTHNLYDNLKKLHTPEKLAELAERMREKQSKEINTPFAPPYNVFPTKGEAQKVLNKKFGIDVGGRMNRLPHLYYYTEDGPGKPPKQLERVYYSEYGVANSIYWHWDKAMKAGCEEAKKVSDPSQNCDKWFNKMAKRNKSYRKTKEPRREWLLEGVGSRKPNQVYKNQYTKGVPKS